MNLRHLASGLACTLLLATPATGEELGRLFFTPQQRQALDRQRDASARNLGADAPTLRIDGVVARSAGQPTVWINGRPQSDLLPGQGAQTTLQPGKPATIRVQPGDAPATELRVGDRIDSSTGETSRLMGDGQLTIRRKP